ncbi:hypothetical protein EDF32_2092 [Cellulomonas sp. PhB143]|nr:hypothetical protein EDF32_2092 [Cellulomonas sp. PhB143]
MRARGRLRRWRWSSSRPFPHAGSDPAAQPAAGSFDLISLQYHSLKAGPDYGQYVRDARNAGKEDIAGFFEKVMAEDSERAKQCHTFLTDLS